MEADRARSCRRPIALANRARTIGAMSALFTPAIRGMRRAYWGLIRDASLDWKNSTLFFGRGVIPPLPAREPRGRYADRRREPAG